MYAGRDELKKGTWLGVTMRGRLAVLTNYRVAQLYSHSNCSSRGLLVAHYLTHTHSLAEFKQYLEGNAQNYDQLNLIFGDMASNEYYFFSNAADSDKQCKKLVDGIYSLSNSLLDVPWFKVKVGKEKFTKILQKHQGTTDFKLIAEDLKGLLMDRELPAPGEQWLRGPGSEQLESMCAPINVRSLEQMYGTRTSTVIAVDHSGHVFHLERTLANPIAETYTEKLHDFHIKQHNEDAIEDKFVQLDDK